jgi:hypothetical protein
VEEALVAEIGVTVTKAVRIDRDGARSLLRAYSDWVNNSVLPRKDKVEQEDVETFLKRYANLPSE